MCTRAFGLMMLLYVVGCGGSQKATRRFQDQFGAKPGYAAYSAVGGATVRTAGDRLIVAVPPGSNGGLEVMLPTPDKGNAVRCMRFVNFVIGPEAVGTRMVWTWFGVDAAGKRYTLLETEIERTGSFTIRHRKADGRLVTQTVEGKNWDDVRSHRGDSRTDGKGFMLEITFKAGPRHNSAWLDPPAGVTLGFTLTTTLSGFSLGMVEGS